jgi:histidinol-phosphatase (PHP family)
MTPADLQNMFEDFVKEARHLQEKYKDQICLIVGLETEVIREDSFDRIRKLKKDLKLDYLVG